MNDNLFQAIDGLTLTSNEAAYQVIADKLAPTDEMQHKQIIQALLAREKTGNIQIDEGVVLPHIEDLSVTQSQILILRPQAVIQDWNEEVQRIDLIIAVMLRPEEELTVKKTITTFMRQLADEDFIERLRTEKKLTELNESGGKLL